MQSKSPDTKKQSKSPNTKMQSKSPKPKMQSKSPAVLSTSQFVEPKQASQKRVATKTAQGPEARPVRKKLQGGNKEEESKAEESKAEKSQENKDEEAVSSDSSDEREAQEIQRKKQSSRKAVGWMNLAELPLPMYRDIS